MCGTAMPQVNSDANTPPGAPVRCISSQMITASAPSPPPPPTASGKPAPSRPAAPARRCRSRGRSPVRSHSSAWGRISRSVNERTVFRSCSRSGVVQMFTVSPEIHSNLPGMSTCRLRSHSPSALACGSNRAW